ncbi:MAG: hypothetical protein AAFU78_08115 [Cyanobacteria bacterium J06633_2]
MSATDFRDTQNLVAERLTINNPPLLCNAALPSDITEAGISPNRDCDRIAQSLSNRYEYSSEFANQIVEDARQREWD